MESSFLLRAKSAINNVAAKAERFLTDIKEDFKTGPASTTTGFEKAVDELNCNVKGENEQQLQEKPYKTLLNLLKDPEKRHLLSFKDCGDVPLEQREGDKELENGRFDCVPQKIQEHQFEEYDLMGVDCVKQSTAHYCKVENGNSDNDQDQPSLESPRKDPVEEDAYERAMSLVEVPPSKLLRKLAAVLEIVRSVSNMKDLMFSKAERDTQATGGLVSGMQAMKNSFLREGKDFKSSKEVQASVQSLFEPDRQPYNFSTCRIKLVEDIHGAPPGSFVALMAGIMGNLKTHQKMAEFWCKTVLELRHHWEKKLPISRLPLDAEPDLRYCLILQKLQVINCCIARQKRHTAELSFLDALNECTERFESLNALNLDSFIAMLKREVAAENLEKLDAARLFAYGKEGQVLLRLGADSPASDLKMLETGQEIYAPSMQEGHVLTEDSIEEKEAFVLRTGSVGAGCSQLLSDMQAFQAANPGCILEDFVRWYSPPDWRQSQSLEPLAKESKDETGHRGYLSARMQSQGNLWQELWSSAKPIPAVKQAPLFDEDLAVESTLTELEDIPPGFLLEQLFIALLGRGFAIAETSSAMKNELVSTQFSECKDFVSGACGKNMTPEELEQLCQVYEMMESMLQNPSEGAQLTKLFKYFQTDRSTRATEKGGRCNSVLFATERGTHGYLISEEKSSGNARLEQGITLFSRLLEAKSTFFEKKQVQVQTTTEDKSMVAQDSEWTVV